ncbi:MAG: hypothetical protein APR63_04190 [Desulfuromonas sp. SDB]|nr:MAG: hypothetical protein APR63_04190 [Desulfuromonas sp. SDB]
MNGLFFLLILNIFSYQLNCQDHNHYYQNWLKICGFEYFRGYNLNRLCLGSAAGGSLNSKIGYGLEFFEILSSNQDTSAYNETTYNLLPISIYWAVPLGNPPYFRNVPDSGAGKIIVIPKFGVYQYPGAIYVRWKTSFLGIAGNEDNKTWVVSSGLALVVEKALYYQTSISVEGGFMVRLCPFRDEYDHLFYAGGAINLLSSWRRYDL